MNSIYSEYISNGDIFDRNVNETITFPWEFNDLIISPNELSINDVLNIKIGKIYENYLFLYGLTKLTSDNIFQNYEGWFGNYKGNLQWVSSNISISGGNLNANINYPDLDNITIWESVSSSKFNGVLNVMSDGTNLSFLNTNYRNTTVSVILSTNIANDFGSLLYNEIVDIAFDDQQNLLVLDSQENNLYLYDVTGFFTNDNIKNNKRYLKNVIGGLGTKYDKNKFKYPTAVQSVSGINFVLDTNNDCIKVYDRELNWLNTIIFIQIFTAYPPIDFAIDSNFICYLITSNNYLLIIDLKTNQQMDIINYNSLLAVGENLKNIKLSYNNSNVFYISTNLNLIKKYKSRPTDEIGRTVVVNNSNLIDAIKFNTFNVINVPSGAYDNIGMSVLNPTSAGIFINYQEPNNYISILDIDNFQIYQQNDLQVNREEYSQNWVFNKSIAKIYNNHLLLLNHIRYQYSFLWDNYENLYYNGLQYIVNYESYRQQISLNYNYFIGINENYQSDAINRCIGEIWNLQNILLGIIRGNIPNNLNSVDISGGSGNEYVSLDCSQCAIIDIKTGIPLYSIDNTKELGQIICSQVTTSCAMVTIQTGQYIYTISTEYPVAPIVCSTD